MRPIKDLGIHFDPKLKCKCHINDVVNGSNKIFGFIRRNFQDFDNTSALKSIYCCMEMLRGLRCTYIYIL